MAILERVVENRKRDALRLGSLAGDAGLTVISAVASAVVFLRCDFWWLNWVALVPFFLVLLRRGKPLYAAIHGLAFGILLVCCALPWLPNMFSDDAFPLLLLAMTFPFAFFAAVAVIFRTHWSSLSPFFAFPVFWLAADFFRCEGWTYQFSWAQLGFSQVTGPLGMPLYPLIGVYGVTFLIVTANSAIAVLCLQWKTRKQTPALVTLALIILLLLASHPLQQLVATQGKHPINAMIVQNEDTGFRHLAELTRGAAKKRHSDVIVWREYAAGEVVGKPEKEAGLQQLARSLQSILVFGCTEEHSASGRHYNAAMIIDSSGRTLGVYHKRHPVQTMEAGVIAGQQSPAFSTPVGRLGIAICYDFDYASSTWQLVHHGAELLVVPTYDAASWSFLQHTQHSRIAQARAAETGRWVVRATSSGISQIINPHGELAASIANGRSAAAIATVFPLTQRTLYTHLFYFLPYGCIFLTVILVTSLTWQILQRKYRTR